jgi:hypothetical protein
MFKWLFGDNEDDVLLTRLYETGQRAMLLESRCRELEDAYRHLRGCLTMMACADGRTNPTIEPIASVLREHDARMAASRYMLPK